MKNSTLSLVALTLLGLILVHSLAEAQNPAELAVRMRVQMLLNMFPSLYEDIRQGRLVPNTAGQYGQQGYLPNQQGGYIQQQGSYIPGQQGQFIPAQPGQLVPAQQG